MKNLSEWFKYFSREFLYIIIFIPVYGSGRYAQFLSYSFSGKAKLFSACLYSVVNFHFIHLIHTFHIPFTFIISAFCKNAIIFLQKCKKVLTTRVYASIIKIKEVITWLTFSYSNRK
nr:MAG TPA: hypothetical protein [Caudoviricetes sp.]